ncbi:hypothetical protein BJ993_002775 [Nocardioides aromaticivorans]|uniref:Uncharacterized protein n=1 Tax=Nocardioides aromaticivorans TaxID=200618 RepID=A0A7Y9ZIW9_9ACTN|nr:hypothetical protein [Nocardioides aromaticivorans]NYI45695.1 hypothetical protein [Nocardioides aromaticivorans]
MNRNRTARTALRLLVATPIAVSAVAFGAGVAHADGFDPDGPIVIANPDGPKGPGDIANPEPEPQPDPPAPEPQGPGDFEQPQPGDDPNPNGPDDKDGPNGEEDPEPNPHGPGDIANPEDGGPDGPGDIANPEPGDEPEDEPADKGGKGGDDKGDKGDKEDLDVFNSGGLIADEVPVPTRIDAGAVSTTEDDQGLELMWVLAGGGVVTAAGAAFARQRLARR